MEFLKDEYLKNKVYKVVLGFVVACGICIFCADGMRVGVMEDAYAKVDKSYKISHITKRNETISSSKLIICLKKIKNITILNFKNEYSSDKIEVSIRISGNKKVFEDVFQNIKNIKGFYSFGNIKIDQYKDGKASAIFYVNFMKKIAT